MEDKNQRRVVKWIIKNNGGETILQKKKLRTIQMEKKIR